MEGPVKKISEKQEWELKLDILDFALKHGLTIHPDKDLDGLCRRTVEMGHCICKDSEPYCPCPDAHELTLERGYCTCRLFLRRDLYPAELAKARERWIRKSEKKKDKGIRL